MDGEEDIPQYSKEVAKGSLWSLAGNAFFKLASFFYLILISRAASPDDVGLFFVALSFVSLISLVSDIGLSGALSRYLPYFEGRNEKGKIKDLLKISYLVTTVSAIIITAIVWSQADAIGGVFNKNPQIPEAIRLLSAFMLLSNLFRLGLSALQGFADMRLMQYVYNTESVLKLVLTASLFYLYGASVWTMSAGLLLSYIPASLLALFYIRNKTINFPSHGGTRISSKQLFGEIAPFGIMLNIVTFFWAITGYADRLLLEYLTAPAMAETTVAIYSVATSLSTALLLFPTGVGNIFLPVMSRLAGKNDRVQMRAVLETAQRWALLVSLPAGLMLVLFSTEMMGAFSGQEYAPGGMTMSIFTVGTIIQALSYMLLLALAALRMVRLELRIAFIVTFVNVLLNAILIPPYGMEGSAAASVASCVVLLVLLSHYSQKLFSFTFSSEIYKLVLAGIITLVAMLLLKPYAMALTPSLPSIDAGALQPYLDKTIYLAFLGVLGAISAAIFLVFATLFKCFRSEDVHLLKKAMHKVKMPRGVIGLVTAIASFGVGARK
jgi:O-antigen/teichoic acid export membrane protein